MKKTLLLLQIYFINYFFTIAQPLSIQWQKCYGGTMDDEFKNVKKMGTGFILGGGAISNDGDVSGNHGLSDYWVVRTDSFGNLLWQNCYGGSEMEVLSALDISGNNFLATGSAGLDNGDVSGVHGGGAGGIDYWTVNGDSAGNLIWAQCFGGSRDEFATEIVPCRDRGSIMIGWARSIDYDVSGLHDTLFINYPSDIWVVKIDSGGSIEWARCYGGYNEEAPPFDGSFQMKIVETPDLGYIFVSETFSNDGDVTGNHQEGALDYWVVKIDSTGDIQWSKCYGGTDNDYPYNIICTNDGGYAVIGVAVSNDFDVIDHHGPEGVADVWIIKIDSVGNLQWTKSLGGTSSDVGFKLIQLADSGYLVLCSTTSTDGDLVLTPANFIDIWIARLDPSGNFQWGQCFGGSSADEAYDLMLTPDGGAIFSGITFSNDLDVSGNHGGSDAWLVKLNPLHDHINNTYNSLEGFSCTVVPGSNSILLNGYTFQSSLAKVNLFDASGRLLYVERIALQQGPNKKVLRNAAPSSGIYFVRLETESGVVTKKLAVSR